MSDEAPRRQVTVSLSAKANPVKYASVEAFCPLSLPIGEGEDPADALRRVGGVVHGVLLERLVEGAKAATPALRAFSKAADGTALNERDRRALGLPEGSDK